MKRFLSEYDEFYDPLEKSILELLEENNYMNRTDLALALNTPESTVYDHLRVLLREGYIKKYSRHDGSPGRPTIFFKLVK